MGKNGKFGKDYGKVVGKDSKSRPGWKGPGYVRKQEPKPKATPEAAEEMDTEPSVSPKLQQLLLNIFKDTFSELLTSDALPIILQEIKAALYDRDFQQAFGKEYLEAYAARWSPSRALCYLSILVDIQDYLMKLVSDESKASTNEHGSQSLHTSSFGGGAAEIVAFGGLLRHLYNAGNGCPVLEDSTPVPEVSSHHSSSDVTISLNLIDTAAWGDVVDALRHQLATPPSLSNYASSSAKSANSSLIPAEKLVSAFSQLDVLSMTQEEVAELTGLRPTLLTFLFTLNELYTASRSKTTELLLNLTSRLKKGSLLLVVDSPGSYSETTVGAEAKKYPMNWLLDHTLLKAHTSDGGEGATAEWVKVYSDDSRWFRLPETLHYPIPLENMRTQVHLYRRS